MVLGHGHLLTGEAKREVVGDALKWPAPEAAHSSFWLKDEPSDDWKNGVCGDEARQGRAAGSATKARGQLGDRDRPAQVVATRERHADHPSASGGSEFPMNEVGRMPTTKAPGPGGAVAEGRR